MSHPLPTVLVAEDEETDALLMQLAFEKVGVDNPLQVARDGQDAVNYLAGLPPFTDRSLHPLPALLILDLKMPRMNGFDVLTWLQTRPEFKDLPAVVLSSSSDDDDVKRALALGARDYFVKPLNINDFIDIIQKLHARWLVSPFSHNSQ